MFFFLNWHVSCIHAACMYSHACIHAPVHTHKHMYFISSWTKTVFKLCIVTLNTWGTKKKTDLICEHFIRGCLTAGLFFTKVYILVHACAVKFKRLQTANTVLHIQCKHLNLQKYQKWQEELQGEIYLTKLKRFMCCGRV